MTRPDDSVSIGACRIGVVIPTRNRPRSTVEAIRSIQSQLAPGDELIVVDNGSTDQTVPVCVEAGVRVIEESRRGPSAARNAGVLALETDWIAFLDSDDLALPGWLTLLRSGMDETTSIVFCSVLYDGTRGLVQPRPMGPMFGDIEGLFLSGSYAVRRSLFVEFGGFDEGLAFGEHTELGLRLAAHCVANGLSTLRVDGQGVRIREGEADRGSRNDEGMLRGAERILALHYKALSADEGTLFSYVSVAGVRAARLGFKVRAIGHFAHAASVSPGPRSVGRLLAAVFGFPILRALLLRRQQRQQDDDALSVTRLKA